ncbi:serine/threonine-protein kinase [Candidatus Mycobacterium methanotrophicum]|uniref:non-specific serine/threonine protein kinase n=1 Tax=Candidatus Mycobacterium methanotrophicum TaxID=2943498 RepID=A0ABY4QPR6_9MYCO|nr:serine/threonine-protein kinase [Candidatus Mycobacterium methanotrophicum]UQX12467.1 serine/threonine-protein kinase [Candidatus Mycobacterium methanotrophicum]
MPLNRGLGEGDVFAGYTIVRRLGSGGMGEVYLARHPRLPRRDALKVLPAGLTADAEYRQRFSREADIAAELWHPHIVGIHDRGEFEGQLWLSMDYVEGTDAAELLRTRFPSGLPKVEVFEIVSAVADALDYANQRGLLHRDVKPANILLTEADPPARRILLADFGIAKDVGDISGLTATNMVVGTTAYAAPEQLMGSDIDGRADQYALGCTAFHLLTGAAPYQNSNPAVVISQHLSAPPPLIGDRRPELAALNGVITKVLAKDPGGRYRTCSDFATALTGQPRTAAAANTLAAQAASAPTTLAATPQSTPAQAPRRRLPPALWVSVVVTVVLLAVAAVVGVDMMRRHAHLPGQSAPTAANPPTDGASLVPSQPGAGVPAAPSSIQLTRYITDQTGVLAPAGRAAVEAAINRLYAQRNVHLWVVYVNDFGGLTPLRWAEETMRANGFSNTDGLLAIATEAHRFSFRVPSDVPGATPANVEAIRRNRIEPAVRNGEWARAAVAAANGLESIG